jgi:hypothetical protein
LSAANAAVGRSPTRRAEAKRERRENRVMMTSIRVTALRVSRRGSVLMEADLGPAISSGEGRNPAL